MTLPSLTVVRQGAESPARRIFSTDSSRTDFAVVIIRTGRTIYTSPDRDLAVSHLRNSPLDPETLEVREVVTTVESRRAFRPRRPAVRELAVARA